MSRFCNSFMTGAFIGIVLGAALVVAVFVLGIRVDIPPLRQVSNKSAEAVPVVHHQAGELDFLWINVLG
jgi:hypothetical protein